MSGNRSASKRPERGNRPDASPAPRSFHALTQAGRGGGKNLEINPMATGACSTL
jgi:hypothetical protein